MSHLSLLSAIPLSLYGLLTDPGMSPEAPIHFKPVVGSRTGAVLPN